MAGAARPGGDTDRQVPQIAAISALRRIVPVCKGLVMGRSFSILQQYATDMLNLSVNGFPKALMYFGLELSELILQLWFDGNEKI